MADHKATCFRPSIAGTAITCALMPVDVFCPVLHFSPLAPGPSGVRHGTYMNRFEKLFGLTSEARVRFGDGDFTVLSAGDYVRCAVTGEAIPLPNLKYWSVELQEAYVSAEVSFNRYLDVRRRKADVAKR